MANKIAVSLRATVSLDVESLTDQFRVLAEDHARVEPAVWQRTGCAIHQRERLRLRYQRFDGATRDYLLDPYHRVAAATAAQVPLARTPLPICPRASGAQVSRSESSPLRVAGSRCRSYADHP